MMKGKEMMNRFYVSLHLLEETLPSSCQSFSETFFVDGTLSKGGVVTPS